MSNLSVGVHTITASVTDSGGLSDSAAIEITVEEVIPPPPVNQPPEVQITAPGNNTSVDEGSEITFTGTATDDEDGSLTGAITWTSSIDGALGSGGSLAMSNLSVGTHTITASVTDSGGLSDSAAIQVTVEEVIPPPPVNQPPEVQITAPGNNTSVDEGVEITFTGTASDDEDDSLD